MMDNERRYVLKLGKIDYLEHGRKDCPVELELSLRLQPGERESTGGGKLEDRHRAKVSDPVELAIHGTIWNHQHTDCYSGGQNLDEIAKHIRSPRFKRIRAIWERWHLNAMRPGCAHQIKFGWDKKPIDPTKPTSSYGKHFAGQRRDSWNLLGWIRPEEHTAGLLTKPCPVCGYKYGSAWLSEPLPKEVEEEVVELFTT